MLESVENIVSNAMGNDVFSKCVIGVIRKDGDGFTKEVRAFGGAMENSIFDIASVTKVIPTLTLALKLIEDRRLELSDKLIYHLPEFNNSDRDKVLIQHLITQTLDYNFRLSAYKDKSPDEILNIIFTTEFRSPPGQKYYYTNATSILLGLVIERMYGEPLDKIADREIFKPLEMSHTSFHPEYFDIDDIIPTEIDEWRGREIRGEVHDESAWRLRDKMIAGSAGVFSTAPDLLKFLEKVLSRDLFSIALGWEAARPYMGKLFKKRIGKTGFTGSVIMVDFEKETGVVILSNYTYPKRKANLPKGRNDFFAKVADAIF